MRRLGRNRCALTRRDIVSHGNSDPVDRHITDRELIPGPRFPCALRESRARR